MRCLTSRNDKAHSVQRVFNRRATNHQIPNHGRPMFWLATCRSWGHAHMQSRKTKSSLS
jgi:hypothetical protein